MSWPYEAHSFFRLRAQIQRFIKYAHLIELYIERESCIDVVCVFLCVGVFVLLSCFNDVSGMWKA